MVYSNKFVMCILLGGHPQQELANGTLAIPFGAEYAIRLRNKHNTRCVVKIYIDGENVSGGGYVINAHDYIDIKRHHDVDRAFKFVALDSEDAIEHGKNGPNDNKVKGTIEARFFLEKEQPKYIPIPVPMPIKVWPQPRPIDDRPRHHHHHYYHHDVSPIQQPPSHQPYRNNEVWCSTLGGATMDHMSVDNASFGGGGTQSKGFIRGQSFNPPIEKEVKTSMDLMDGATVEGNLTGQNFYSVHCETESAFTSLKIFLQGFVAETSKKKKKKTKVDSIEAENDKLRLQLAEAENERLKKQLKEITG